MGSKRSWGSHIAEAYLADCFEPPEPPDDSPRERVFILPPELSDGEHFSIVRKVTIGIVQDALLEWITEAEDGEEISIGWREMSVAEIERLPDI